MLAQIMGKHKKNKPKREKKEMVYRTRDQRHEEVKNILMQLSEFQLKPTYEPIKELYSLFKTYIDEGKRTEINIAFPEIGRRIKGLLASSVREEVWVRLEKEKI
jgi:hypothetical protein